MFGILIHWSFVPICFLVGLFIIAIRPYWGFLYAMFLNVIFGVKILFLLRVPGIGAYFNLNDVSMYLSILALIAEWRQARGKFIFPKVIFAILIVILIGFVVSLIRYPDNFYYTLRGLRWAIHLPIYFIIGANLVRGEKRIRQLLLTIIFGGCLASLQHIFWIEQTRQMVGVFYMPEVLRNIEFLRAEQHVWLIAGFFIIAGKIPRKWLQAGIGTLFLLVTLTHQTRSIALAVAGALVLYYMWFLRGSSSFRLKRIRFLVVIVVITIFMTGVLRFTALAENYWHRISYSWEYMDSDPSLDTRKMDIAVEFKDWREGNMIIGEGLYYYPRHVSLMGRGESLIGITGIGFGHIGYINYLSQLGIIGFFVYAVWFQLAVLTRARQAFRTRQQKPWAAHASALAGALFLYVGLISFMSSTPYLGHGAVIPGILSGLVWAISLPKNLQRTTS